MKRVLLIFTLASVLLLGVLVSCDDNSRGDLTIGLDKLVLDQHDKLISFQLDSFVELVKEDFKLEKAESDSGSAADPYIWEEVEELFGQDGKVEAMLDGYSNGKLLWNFQVRVAVGKIVEGEVYRLTITKEGFSFIDIETDEEDGWFIREAVDLGPA